MPDGSLNRTYQGRAHAGSQVRGTLSEARRVCPAASCRLALREARDRRLEDAARHGGLSVRAGLSGVVRHLPVGAGAGRRVISGPGAGIIDVPCTRETSPVRQAAQKTRRESHLASVGFRRYTIWVRLTYDPAKREKTLTERGLDFEDALIIFDGPTVEIEDTRKDYGERRIICFGRLEDRMIVVGYTPRGAVRHVFSMRKANAREEARIGPQLEV